MGSEIGQGAESRAGDQTGGGFGAALGDAVGMIHGAPAKNVGSYCCKCCSGSFALSPKSCPGLQAGNRPSVYVSKLWF